MISILNLKKRFGYVEALKGINFHINKGELYALLGPNGAGKTTTISILSAILPFDSGEVEIGTFDLKKNPKKCKEIIGVIPQEIALYGNLSGYDNLMFWGSLYDIESSKLKKNIDTHLKLLGLFDRRQDKIKTYSVGMKRRINIAAALLHSPQILLIDEPTVGVDPQSRNLIFEVIEKLHDEGITIIYTTHYMEEAERLCDRIGIIDNGQIIAQGTLVELKKIHKIKEAIIIHFNSLHSANHQKLTKDFDENLIINGNSISCYSDSIGKDLPRLISKSNKLGLDITHIDIQKATLETLFLSLTGKKLRDWK